MIIKKRIEAVLLTKISRKCRGQGVGKLKKGFNFDVLKPLSFLSPRQGSNLRPVNKELVVFFVVFSIIRLSFD